jgi:hypothetical protein
MHADAVMVAQYICSNFVLATQIRTKLEQRVNEKTIAATKRATQQLLENNAAA